MEVLLLYEKYFPPPPFIFTSRYLGKCSISGYLKVLGGQKRSVSQSRSEEESRAEKLLTGKIDPSRAETDLFSIMYFKEK